MTADLARAKRLAPAAPASAKPETGGTLTVDLAAIETNWRTLAHRLLTVECGAVVKANAYGLGLEPVTATLVKAGCKSFFVADIAEARRVRSRAADAAIYVLDGFTTDWGDAFIEIDARPVINSTTELAEWDAFASSRSWQGGAALHVDTGMRRLGMSPEETAALAPRAQTENHGIALLMSHLACADNPRHPLNAAQIALFRELHLLYPGIPASLANSSGIFLGDTAHYDLARPGAALYGINPTPGELSPVKDVVELTGRILQLRTVASGDTVGYGATWTAKRSTRIAIVALGYADGLMRAGSGTDERPGGMAIVSGRRCPIVGRISMDLVCIDVTDVNAPIHRGDLATLIGDGLLIDEVAAAAGTIGYEILTRLGSRFHLVYRGEQELGEKELSEQESRE
jgi:alanine racemase